MHDHQSVRIKRCKIFTNGRYYDELLFGMTREEWSAAQGAD